MKKHFLARIGTTILLFCIVATGIYATEFSVTSPDGRLKMTLQVTNSITYQLSHNNLPLLSPSQIAIILEDGRIIGRKPTVASISKQHTQGIIPTPFGKSKEISEEYNELTLRFNEGYSLIIRAYNEGAAYRFKTHLNGDITVKNEEANFTFAGNPEIYFPEADEQMINFERLYVRFNSIKDIDLNNNKIRYSTGPLLASYPTSYSRTPYKLIITESDQLDYPGMYLFREGNSPNSLKGFWPGYPKEVKEPNNIYQTHYVESRHDYIARTTGNRLFPWRVFIVSTDDKDLLNNELVYKLAKPLEMDDTSWIRPGKSAWEWWHKAMLEKVKFPIGYDNLGLELYKYYVDFAAENHIEFMTLDAGWKEEYLQELCTYAKEKGVGIFVWTWANMPVENEQWLPRMKSLGVTGVKVDFFDRDDQIAVSWLEKVAKDCADNQLLLLFHGAPKPTGLHRAYPHILNYESVRGAECNFWDRGSDPDYHLQFPFIRMLNGPFDYTPGSMRNTTKEAFIPRDLPNTIPMSMGTRSHELAMYILFDHPLAYLCDSPTEYRKYPDIMEFLSKVPTTWDQTIPLDARLSEYALIARQKGEDWYVGGMTNWEERSTDINFSFLPDSRKYHAYIIKDAKNSNQRPQRYLCEKLSVDNTTSLKFNMSKGGGFVIRITPE